MPYLIPYKSVKVLSAAKNYLGIAWDGNLVQQTAVLSSLYSHVGNEPEGKESHLISKSAVLPSADQRGR